MTTTDNPTPRQLSPEVQAARAWASAKADVRRLSERVKRLTDQLEAAKGELEDAEVKLRFATAAIANPAPTPQQ